MNDLSPEMQKRLDLWKANILNVKSQEIFKHKSPGNYVARNRDYGDDFSDIDNKKKNDDPNKSIFTGCK